MVGRAAPDDPRFVAILEIAPAYSFQRRRRRHEEGRRGALLGVIRVGGGSFDSHKATTDIQSHDNGFTVADTSGAPSVIGVMVKQIFPS